MKTSRLCGIAFSINRQELFKLEALPSNYFVIHDKDNDRIIIFYPIKAPIDTWKNWQWFGEIKIRLSRIFTTIEFRHVHEVGEYSFTIKSFSDSFKTGDESIDFVRLPHPWYPASKGFNELRFRLYDYAKKLFFDSMLNFELLWAMALRFNELTGNHYSIRNLKKITENVFEADKSKWPKRKGRPDNTALNLCKKKTAAERKSIAYKLAPLFTDERGTLDLASLSSSTNIPIKTLYRYGLRKHASPHRGHIRQQCENFCTESLNKGISTKKMFKQHYIRQQCENFCEKDGKK